MSFGLVRQTGHTLNKEKTFVSTMGSKQECKAWGKEEHEEKHTDSTAAGAVGSTDSKFIMRGAAMIALSWSITSLGGGRGLLRR